MKLWYTVQALLAVAASAFLTRAAENPSDVFALNNGTFADFVYPGREDSSENLVLVEFYAPWCGHCKALAPEYEKAATILKEDGIKLAKVDCDADAGKPVCEKYQVQGYPTMKVFRGGIATEYSGPREADGIVSYMKLQALPALSDVAASDLHEFKDTKKVVVVGFFKSKDSSTYKELLAVANRLRDELTFGATIDEAAAKDFGVKAPAVILFKKFDEGRNVFDGNFTEEALVTFVKNNAVPLMDDIGRDNYGIYMESGLPMAYLFVSSDKEKKELGPEIEKVAKEFKGKVNFVYIDAVNFGAHAQNLNLKEEWPAFAVHYPQTDRKFPFDQNEKITGEAISEFVSKVIGGEIEQSLKSEPIPEENGEPVKVVVRKTFDEVVKDVTKDVLIEFYSPNCGYCDTLAPIYVELGIIYANASDVVIAKMDATANDLPPDTGVEIQGFPTIILFKAGNNEMVEYSGSRTLESFLIFLKKYAVSKFEPKEITKESTEEAAHDEL